MKEDGGQTEALTSVASSRSAVAHEEGVWSENFPVVAYATGGRREDVAEGAIGSISGGERLPVTAEHLW